MTASPFHAAWLARFHDLPTFPNSTPIMATHDGDMAAISELTDRIIAAGPHRLALPGLYEIYRATVEHLGWGPHHLLEVADVTRTMLDDWWASCPARPW